MGELVVEKTAGVEESDVDLGDLVGDGAEDGLGVATFEGGEDGDGFEVGVETVKETAGRNLAGHVGVAGVEAFEGLEHGADLADLEEDAVGFGEFGDQLGRGFLLHRHEAQGHTGGADGVGHESGIEALAGDEGDGFFRIETGW